MNEPVAKAVMRLSDKDRVQHYTFCPKHNKRTSDVVGLQKDIDGNLRVVFRCKEDGVHLFAAEPDPTAPKTADDVDKWMKKQRLARIRENDKKAKGQ